MGPYESASRPLNNFWMVTQLLALALVALHAAPTAGDNASYVVRHADAELLAEGETSEAAQPALEAPLPDLDGLGVKALKGLCAQRGVDVSRCLEKGDIVDALRTSAPAVAPPAAETALAAPALPLPESVAQFVELIFSKSRRLCRNQPVSHS